jgi:hypothetical protein
MAVPTSRTDLSATIGSNSPLGSETISSGTGPDEYLRAHAAFIRQNYDDLRTSTVSVKDYGAVGDGSTDDTAAIQAAINALATSSGGTLVFTPGYYKVTGTLSVGSAIVTNYEFISDRVAPMDDTAFAANDIPANITTNQSRSGVDLIFQPGAILVAAWAPSTREPVIAYNLDAGTFAGHGRIIGASIISSAMLTGGVYDQDATSTAQTNKLVGIFATRGCKEINNIFISGLQDGIISLNAYWTKIDNVRVWLAGGCCVDIAQGNALTANNLVMLYSTVGLQFDGDASQVRGIHTQQVAQDMRVLRADCCTFGPAYLEDVSAATGAGTYAVAIGYVENDNKVICCRFENIRVGNVRSGKSGLRIWDSTYVSFNACRLYSSGYVKDTASHVILYDCDFASTTLDVNTKVTSSGAEWWSNNLAVGSDYIVNGPWMFNISSVTVGVVTAGGTYNHDYTLPASMNSVNNATAIASYAAGGNPLLVLSTRILFTTPKKVRISFCNPSAASIDGGTLGLSLTVFSGT